MGAQRRLSLEIHSERKSGLFPPSKEKREPLAPNYLQDQLTLINLHQSNKPQRRKLFLAEAFSECSTAAPTAPNSPRELWSSSGACGGSTRAGGSISHSQADLQTALPAHEHRDVEMLLHLFMDFFLFSTERVVTFEWIVQGSGGATFLGSVQTPLGCGT